MFFGVFFSRELHFAVFYGAKRGHGVKNIGKITVFEHFLNLGGEAKNKKKLKKKTPNRVYNL